MSLVSSVSGLHAPIVTRRSRMPTTSANPLSIRRVSPVHGRGERHVVRADDDFDAILAKMADKFEKTENKPAVIGYSAAALGVLVLAEWFIHLPVFNFLLGGPIQLLGLLLLPVLGVRYLVDNESISEDVAKSTTKITKMLPGLDK